MWDSSRLQAAKLAAKQAKMRAAEAELNRRTLSLAAREPTLVYRIVPVEAEAKVLIKAWRANSKRQSDGALIATGTVTEIGEDYPHLQQLTSKDTDRIDALPDVVRDGLVQMDDLVREQLRTTADEAGTTREPPRRPSLADREPTLAYIIWATGADEYLLSAYPESPAAIVPLASIRVTGASGQQQPPLQSLTSKDTDRIDALPEELRDAIFDLDDTARASLKTNTPTPTRPSEPGTGRLSECHPGRPALADREPTLVYRIVPIPAGEKVLAKVYWASPKEHRRRARIGTFTITDFGEDYPDFQQFTTKDTDRINALPEAIRNDLLDIDDKVRAHLKDLARQNVKRRLPRRPKPAG